MSSGDTLHQNTAGQAGESTTAKHAGTPAAESGGGNAGNGSAVSADSQIIDQVAAKPNHCGHCDARLSAVEVKMGRCLSCGRQLGADSAESGGGSGIGPRSFEIRI